MFLTLNCGLTTKYGYPERAFFQKSWTFGLGQTFWAKIWGIWGIFGMTISTYFGTVSSLSMFSIIQPLFLQKTKSLYPTPKYLFGSEYLFGSGVWFWAAKNLRFSLHVSVVRGIYHLKSSANLTFPYSCFAKVQKYNRAK
jgi:hypothetical protein